MNKIIRAKLDYMKKLADDAAKDPGYVPRKIPVSSKDDGLARVIKTKEDAEAFLLQIEALSLLAASRK